MTPIFNNIPGLATPFAADVDAGGHELVNVGDILGAAPGLGLSGNTGAFGGSAAYAVRVNDGSDTTISGDGSGHYAAFGYGGFSADWCRNDFVTFFNNSPLQNNGYTINGSNGDFLQSNGDIDNCTLGGYAIDSLFNSGYANNATYAVYATGDESGNNISGTYIPYGGDAGSLVVYGNNFNDLFVGSDGAVYGALKLVDDGYNTAVLSSEGGVWYRDLSGLGGALDFSGNTSDASNCTIGSNGSLGGLFDGSGNANHPTGALYAHNDEYGNDISTTYVRNYSDIGGCTVASNGELGVLFSGYGEANNAINARYASALVDGSGHNIYGEGSGDYSLDTGSFTIYNGNVAATSFTGGTLTLGGGNIILDGVDLEVSFASNVDVTGEGWSIASSGEGGNVSFTGNVSATSFTGNFHGIADNATRAYYGANTDAVLLINYSGEVTSDDRSALSANYLAVAGNDLGTLFDSSGYAGFAHTAGYGGYLDYFNGYSLTNGDNSLLYPDASGALKLADTGGNLYSPNGNVLADSGGRIYPVQAAATSAPAYIKGAMYFDTTLNKLRIGGATAWETVTSA